MRDESNWNYCKSTLLRRFPFITSTEMSFMKSWRKILWWHLHIVLCRLCDILKLLFPQSKARAFVIYTKNNGEDFASAVSSIICAVSSRNQLKTLFSLNTSTSWNTGRTSLSSSAICCRKHWFEAQVKVPFCKWVDLESVKGNSRW